MTRVEELARVLRCAVSALGRSFCSQEARGQEAAPPRGRWRAMGKLRCPGSYDAWTRRTLPSMSDGSGKTSWRRG